MEHHSNIVPWQLVAEQTGAIVRPIPVTDEGEVRLDEYERMLSERVKIVGVVHVSNSLGTINPVAEMIRSAHAVGAVVLVDGAQAGPHRRIDVQALEADFYTLSRHKIYAPTGVGVLYGGEALLEAMPPYHGGGDMIRSVSFEGTTYADLPGKFEAGTPNIAGVIGLGRRSSTWRALGVGRWALRRVMRSGRLSPLSPDRRSVLTERTSAGLGRSRACAWWWYCGGEGGDPVLRRGPGASARHRHPSSTAKIAIAIRATSLLHAACEATRAACHGARLLCVL